MSAEERFRTLRPFMGPPWLTKGEGELVGYSLDLMRDAFIQRLFLGLLCRFPETAPTDALAAIGRQRRVVRGINETAESYVARLLVWLDDRKRQGNPYALMQKLAEYTGPVPSWRTVDRRGNWYSRAADGTETALLNQANWDWDGVLGEPKWSRFWVIMYPNGFYDDQTSEWGDSGAQDWGDRDRGTWGTTAPPDQVQMIRALVSDWKIAGTRCVSIVEALDPSSFDPTAAVDSTGMPDGLWLGWSKNVGGVQVPARLDTARYWEGV